MSHKCLGLNIILVFSLVLLYPKSVNSKSKRLTEYINITSNDAVKNIPVIYNLLKQAKKNNQPQKVILCLLSPNGKMSSENDSTMSSGVEKNQDNIKIIEENTNFNDKIITKPYADRTEKTQRENNIMGFNLYNATLTKKSDFPETIEVDLYDDSDILTRLSKKFKKSKSTTMSAYYPASEPEHYHKGRPSPQRATKMCCVDIKGGRHFEPKILFKDTYSNLPEKLNEFIEQNQVVPKIGCAYDSNCFGGMPGVHKMGQMKPVKLIAKIYKEEPITDEVKQFAFYLPSNGQHCEYKPKPKMNWIEYPTVKYPDFTDCPSE